MSWYPFRPFSPPPITPPYFLDIACNCFYCMLTMSLGPSNKQVAATKESGWNPFTFKMYYLAIFPFKIFHLSVSAGFNACPKPNYKLSTSLNEVGYNFYFAISSIKLAPFSKSGKITESNI